MTVLPPGWMQKCSKAVLKSGVYGFSERRPSTCARAGLSARCAARLCTPHPLRYPRPCRSERARAGLSMRCAAGSAQRAALARCRLPHAGPGTRALLESCPSAHAGHACMRDVAVVLRAECITADSAVRPIRARQERRSQLRGGRDAAAAARVTHARCRSAARPTALKRRQAAGARRPGGRALRANRLPTKMSFSDSGSTSGPSSVMLALSALLAVSMTSRPIFVPILPSSSSLVMTALRAPAALQRGWTHWSLGARHAAPPRQAGGAARMRLCLQARAQHSTAAQARRRAAGRAGCAGAVAAARRARRAARAGLDARGRRRRRGASRAEEGGEGDGARVGYDPNPRRTCRPRRLRPGACARGGPAGTWRCAGRPGGWTAAPPRRPGGRGCARVRASAPGLLRRRRRPRPCALMQKACAHDAGPQAGPVPSGEALCKRPPCRISSPTKSCGCT